MQTYVLDTNIIMHNPYFINTLKNSYIVIPSIVLEELDNNKNNPDVSLNVRIFSNILDKLYKSNYITENNSKVVILTPTFDDFCIDYLKNMTKNDNLIISLAYMLSKKNNVILVTNDILMKVKARGIGLNVKNVTDNEIYNELDSVYSGYTEFYLDDKYIDTLFYNKILDINIIDKIKIYPHMFIILKSFDSKKSALVKIDENCSYMELINIPENIWGIKPKNAQQIMLLNLLLNKNIPLVTIAGGSGTGKTLLTLASSLYMVEDEMQYKKIICTKPVVPNGKDIGFLPGEKEEKLRPWMQSYYDNLEYIFGGEKEMHDALQGINSIEIDALTYMRGRTLPDQFIIVDEVQNMTRHEVKTILTRVGANSKIILMGDPNQIDSKNLTPTNNGLVYAIDKFKDQKVAGHIKLEKGERSLLSDIASKIL